MEDIEIKAEVFRVIRANSDLKSPRAIYQKIREHLPEITDKQIGKVLEELWRE